MDKRIIKRGEIYFVDFGNGEGSEQGGIRPALIIQNNIGNRYAPTTIVAPITSILSKKAIPTHVGIPFHSKHTLAKDSMILCEQVRTVSKTRLRDRHGTIDEETLERVKKALLISLAL